MRDPEGQVGAGPVEHRHEVVADDLDSRGGDVAQALAIGVDMRAPLAFLLLDVLGDRQALDHLPGEARMACRPRAVRSLPAACAISSGLQTAPVGTWWSAETTPSTPGLQHVVDGDEVLRTEPPPGLSHVASSSAVSALSRARLTRFFLGLTSMEVSLVCVPGGGSNRPGARPAAGANRLHALTRQQQNDHDGGSSNEDHTIPHAGAGRRRARARCWPAPALAAEMTLKLGHLANEENIWHKAALKFGEELVEADRRPDRGPGLPERVARQGDGPHQRHAARHRRHDHHRRSRCRTGRRWRRCWPCPTPTARSRRWTRSPAARSATRSSRRSSRRRRSGRSPISPAARAT